MKISQKQRDALYGAIHNTIMDYRIQNRTGENPTIDYNIAQIEQKMWPRVCDALGIERNPSQTKPKRKVRQ